ncbi:hypothetical protein ACT8ZV_22600 [Nocardioides sp. MAHUQ-72]|uniref:hypothetical protein n=1 Tax=unclassified Nocardioides TaxID=2615069 RepID=UPI003616345A
MTVYLAWTSAPVPDDLAGPWEEVRRAAPGLLLVESGDTLSRVYHELKWSLPDEGPLLVAPLAARPKLKGLEPGTQTWLRDRIPE